MKNANAKNDEVVCSRGKLKKLKFYFYYLFRLVVSVVINRIKLLIVTSVIHESWNKLLRKDFD